jgi:hypothetical protein
MIDLFRADGGTGLTKGYVFDDPPEVEFTGSISSFASWINLLRKW